MKTHQLKTYPQFFRDIKLGIKTFEIRKNDRDYKSGDILELFRFDKSTGEIGKCPIVVKVPYIIYGPQFGIDKDYCVMSIEIID